MRNLRNPHVHLLQPACTVGAEGHVFTACAHHKAAIDRLSGKRCLLWGKPKHMVASCSSSEPSELGVCWAEVLCLLQASGSCSIPRRCPHLLHASWATL